MGLGRKDCFLPKKVTCALQGRGDREPKGDRQRGNHLGFPMGRTSVSEDDWF